MFWGTLALALFGAAWPLIAPAPRTKFPIAEFSRLPVLEGGRVKPVDSFARNSLLLIRGTQTLPLGHGRTLSATQWLLDAMFKPETADTYEIFTIDDPDVLGLIGLEPGRQRRYAYWKLQASRDEIDKQAQSAERIPSEKRSRFQSAVINLASRLNLYEQIKNTIMVSGDGNPASELRLFEQVVPEAVRAAHSGRGATARGKAAMKALAQLLERYQFLAKAAAFRCLPPRSGQGVGAWASFGEGMLTPPPDSGPHPGLADWALMGDAWRRSDPAAFRSAVSDLTAWVQRVHPEYVSKLDSEVEFNEAQPFVSGMALYVLALLAIFVWWGTLRDEVRAAAVALTGAAVLVHTAGLLARIWLQGRPPVTNLYSSAVFVGWAAALLGLAAERIHKKGFAIAGGCLLGFCTLVIAQHLSASGDTMEMMRAVLDSNFWLATHVVTVTIGYASTFLAGALGIAWVLRRQLLKNPDPATTRDLVALAYGVVAFALLFSFIGTTLGGIWADQSWGRFWGWDPKENGALLIVLWNAIILHARFSGVARERGIMTMTVFGNVVTALSWFGVNMLGIGLHSYGFMQKAFYWLTLFCASQLVLVVLGLLPPRWFFADDEDEAAA
ncbi:MAG: cytochrome c biogenesis protein CcsA [Elusimicrobia bacterium]|nr:cytochrome c biogenesis protein CcsA [Elusimicrobiota bacterium]